ncbi:hypothetical protein [Capnocytophaga catalasegens]|uniref:Uncharacterized protein n=1 Tax=Capnocytophaga catalasegens TaxID=1004260 RepID=A0AAV5AXC8_9FLAO|nr:hypothetical protein [Capnocytophaga catalasegens]GIZ15300.1 hypothetical protein RCZ03_13000 [Capnocytophaga catalasegens]GJM51234.1 hypothetical protein RCZ15_22070 [Capnocytophaga catalasegens]GJM53028.1 hypothetical protein RCZ16_13450 [Capnocytophaga catalasegens]
MEQIFKDNPKLDEVYRTSDGKYFYLESDARNYATAAKLHDKKVTKLVRKATLNEDTNNENQDVKRAEKIAELQALELVKENYNQMKSLVKFFDIKTSNQSAEALIEALTEFKKTI